MQHCMISKKRALKNVAILLNKINYNFFISTNIPSVFKFPWSNSRVLNESLDQVEKDQDTAFESQHPRASPKPKEHLSLL